MRISLPLFSLALFSLVPMLAACSAPAPEERTTTQDLKTYDIEEAPAAEMTADASTSRVAAPGIVPTAAPGVAFNYRYAFRLPGARISAIQEAHASHCEKLGLDRCRITGMRYRLVNERGIEGMLSFKLDPAIARSFGKQSIDAVQGAEGMLVDAAISGEDVGTQIDAGTRAESQLGADLRRIEQQLARPGLRAAERAELQAQAQQLRGSIRANAANQTDRRESLARTPMTFIYGSGDLVPGFDTHSPLRGALERSGDNLIAGLSFMLIIAISLLPWALLALLGWWLWRRFRPRPASAGPGETETVTG